MFDYLDTSGRDDSCIIIYNSHFYIYT